MGFAVKGSMQVFSRHVSTLARNPKLSNRVLEFRLRARGPFRHESSEFSDEVPRTGILFQASSTIRILEFEVRQ